ncbi:MAG: hypothetical protein L3J87_03845 [Thermoplasmata archaeon]|nr:hypothetical protein [Thermoplasmata archaeon]
MKGRGWWSAVAVVVGFAAAAAISWGSLPTPVDCTPSYSGNTPLGSALAFTSPTEESVGTDHWYNFTIASVSPPSPLQDLKFGVQTSSGQPVSADPDWAAHMLDHGGSTIGIYTI